MAFTLNIPFHSIEIPLLIAIYKDKKLLIYIIYMSHSMIHTHTLYVASYLFLPFINRFSEQLWKRMIVVCSNLVKLERKLCSYHLIIGNHLQKRSFTNRGKATHLKVGGINCIVDLWSRGCEGTATQKLWVSHCRITEFLHTFNYSYNFCYACAVP